jgi:hypothetical protein
VERTAQALARQDEAIAADGAAAVATLGAGCEPAPEWSRFVLDAHESGYAVVAGAVDRPSRRLRRRRSNLAYARWRPEADVRPPITPPLLCPSVVVEAEQELFELDGLPAAHPTEEEPWLVDPRIAITAPARSGRRRA